MEQPISLYREKTTIYNYEGGGTPHSTPLFVIALHFSYPSALATASCYILLLSFGPRTTSIL